MRGVRDRFVAFLDFWGTRLIETRGIMQILAGFGRFRTARFRLFFMESSSYTFDCNRLTEDEKRGFAGFVSSVLIFIGLCSFFVVGWGGNSALRARVNA